MIARDLMTSDVTTCSAAADLATVAHIMWECDCGAVPVVNEDRTVTGMITDRDICIAAATRCAAPQSIQVHEIMATEVYTCSVDDDVRAVLNTMKERRVRRLPVLDEHERLVGIVSMNDLVAKAECRKGADVPGEDFLTTLKAICSRSSAAAAA
jgi:CBS domain-containing protein